MPNHDANRSGVRSGSIQIDILTIFPDFFRGPFDHGIIRRAQEAGLAEIRIHDLRSSAHDRHKTVDDRPFGGGEGMVLKPEPIFESIEKLGFSPREERLAGGSGESVILLSAQGQRFDQAAAEKLARLERLVLICGRYEGVDERVGEHLADRELSIGDYVLTGGELAAAVVLDAIVRLIPGALGNEASAVQESFSGRGESGGDTPNGALSTCPSGGLLDYPHYTPSCRFPGMDGTGGARLWQSRRDPPLATAHGARKNAEEPPGTAPRSGAKRRRQELFSSDDGY
jgi:tRNA (guanine37-N1)-methyltransferase